MGWGAALPRDLPRAPPFWRSAPAPRRPPRWGGLGSHARPGPRLLLPFPGQPGRGLAGGLQPEGLGREESSGGPPPRWGGSKDGAAGGAARGCGGWSHTGPGLHYGERGEGTARRWVQGLGYPGDRAEVLGTGSHDVSTWSGIAACWDSAPPPPAPGMGCLSLRGQDPRVAVPDAILGLV